MPADLLCGEDGGEWREQSSEGAAASVEDADTLVGEVLLQVADGLCDAAEEDGGALGFKQAEGGPGGAEGFAGGKHDAGGGVEVEGVDLGGLLEDAVPGLHFGVDEAALLGVVEDEAEGVGEGGAGLGWGQSEGHDGDGIWGALDGAASLRVFTAFVLSLTLHLWIIRRSSRCKWGSAAESRVSAGCG